MHKALRAILVGWTALGLGAAAYGAEQPMTPAQALSFTRVGDLHFSPDGTRLAFVAYSYAWDWQPHLRVAEATGGATRDLTPQSKSERSPQWSSDGKTLAFLSNRGGTTQVYIMPADGGDAIALTSAKFSVNSYQWSRDGGTIAYLAKEDDAPSADSPQVADSDSNLPRLWLVDVASKVTRRVASSNYRIDEYQWQDSTHLLVAATDKSRVEEFIDAIYSVSTADGTFALVATPPQPFEGLLVSPDGKQFALRSTGANGPIARDLFLATFSDPRFRDISIPPGLAVADAKWSEQSAIWVRVIDGFYNRVLRIAAHAAPARIDLPLSVASFDVSRGGVLAFVGEDYTHLPQIFLRAPDGSNRQLGDVQTHAAGIRLKPATIFKTKSFDGTIIEAALIEPDAAAAGRRPLVLLVHGGPSSNFSAGYGWQSAWAQLLAAHGYQVLMVNPRGSNGYSEDFVKANRGDWGGGDYQDLLAVLDAVIARGGTDRARLGIGGWSYGGEMSEWAITQTDLFKAAVVGAGVFDQQMEFETEHGSAGDEWYFGTPWENPEVFARNSPSTYIRNAHTPTLILGGEEDTNNPVGQSKGLYRALKHFGVEAQMVLYPGEGHSPRRGSYNIDMFERILAWYDRHLGDEAVRTRRDP